MNKPQLFVAFFILLCCLVEVDCTDLNKKNKTVSIEQLQELLVDRCQVNVTPIFFGHSKNTSDDQVIDW
jgi:hypothetical protein